MADFDPEELIEDAAEMEEAAKDDRSLVELGLAAWHLDQDIAATELALKSKKKLMMEMQEKIIPAKLTELGLPAFEFETPEGKVARIANSTRILGSLNYAEDQEAAVQYLEESGLKGGVKTIVSIDFVEDEREAAEEFAEGINRNSNARQANITRQITPATLASFARSKLKDDPTWDFAKVGLTAYPFAKFTKR